MQPVKWLKFNTVKDSEQNVRKKRSKHGVNVLNKVSKITIEWIVALPSYLYGGRYLRMGFLPVSAFCNTNPCIVQGVFYFPGFGISLA